MTGNPLLVLVGISVIGWLLAGPAAGQGDASGEEVRRERKITVMPKSVTYKKAAEDKLVQKVMKGGAGVWGPVPMPANPQVSEAEARSLVKWVLATK